MVSASVDRNDDDIGDEEDNEVVTCGKWSTQSENMLHPLTS